MISREEEKRLCTLSIEMIRKTGINFSDIEYTSMVTADFGLCRPRTEGIQVLTFVNTPFIGAKVIVNLPGQTMVEHWHPSRENDPGKEETLRCLYGTCLVYIPGEDSMKEGYVPEGQEKNYNCRNEIVLHPREQYTLSPGVPHWFQPGKEGSVILSISTQVTDQEDQFSNTDIIRQTIYSD